MLEGTSGLRTEHLACQFMTVFGKHSLFGQYRPERGSKVTLPAGNFESWWNMEEGRKSSGSVSQKSTPGQESQVFDGPGRIRWQRPLRSMSSSLWRRVAEFKLNIDFMALDLSVECRAGQAEKARSVGLTSMGSPQALKDHDAFDVCN